MASTRNKVMKYSKSETTLLKLLPNGRSVSSIDLTDQFYTMIRKRRPFYARKSLTAIMTSLIRKVEHNREAFKIMKGAPIGPFPIEYIKVKR